MFTKGRLKPGLYFSLSVFSLHTSRAHFTCTLHTSCVMTVGGMRSEVCRWGGGDVCGFVAEPVHISRPPHMSNSHAVSRQLALCLPSSPVAVFSLRVVGP